MSTRAAGVCSQLLQHSSHIHPLHGHCQGTASPLGMAPTGQHLRDLHLQSSPGKGSPSSPSSSSSISTGGEQFIILGAQQSTFPWKQGAFSCLLTALESFFSQMLGHRTGVSKPGSEQIVQSQRRPIMRQVFVGDETFSPGEGAGPEQHNPCCRDTETMARGDRLPTHPAQQAGSRDVAPAAFSPPHQHGWGSASVPRDHGHIPITGEGWQHTPKPG